MKTARTLIVTGAVALGAVLLQALEILIDTKPKLSDYWREPRSRNGVIDISSRASHLL